jgi:hypothetical protein
VVEAKASQLAESYTVRERRFGSYVGSTVSEGASKVQDRTRRPTESTVQRARGRSKAKAERGREGRAQTSTGREAFSRSIISQTTSREREPAHRAAGKSRRIRSHRR